MMPSAVSHETTTMMIMTISGIRTGIVDGTASELKLPPLLLEKPPAFVDRELREDDRVPPFPVAMVATRACATNGRSTDVTPSKGSEYIEETWVYVDWSSVPQP
jgi:hypothetical protein